MTVFVSIVIYFGPIITKLDKQMNSMNQSTAACGMMFVAFFQRQKQKSILFQSPVLSVLHVGISWC